MPKTRYTHKYTTGFNAGSCDQNEAACIRPSSSLGFPAHGLQQKKANTHIYYC